jgi:hypothetical protein
LTCPMANLCGQAHAEAADSKCVDPRGGGVAVSVPGRTNGTARPEWRHASAVWETDHQAQRGGVERRRHAHLKCHSARPSARLQPRTPSL